MAENFSYFMPHIGVVQSPKSAFATKDECLLHQDKCVGYDSVTGNGFDANVLTDGSKMKLYTDPIRGTYFSKYGIYKNACGYLKGTMDEKNKKCNLTLDQAKEATAVHPQISKFSVMNDNEEFMMAMLKSILIVFFLIMILRFIHRLKL